MHTSFGNRFLAAALAALCFALFFGLLAGLYYLDPSWGTLLPGFEALRPMHVSAAMFWILLGATGCVYYGIQNLWGARPSNQLAGIQGLLWLVGIGGIFYSYFSGTFGGREYWEFDPVWALPIAGAWLIFLYNFVNIARKQTNWPVYAWMWMTGIIFFLFSFAENYLWLFPYFRGHVVTDMTIQWKVNGSLVGAWNQLLYGTAFFIMERISKNAGVGRSKLAFTMYFLGLFNLMFNWGHHIYTLPTEPYVRYVGYAVSMTEWVFFAKIVYNWKKSVGEAQRHYHYFPYRFLMAADVWVFLNLGMAMFMSIPAFNLYTHGTHVTVAHAMGTTIGINSMILMAACFEFPEKVRRRYASGNRLLNGLFWTIQVSLFVFWLALNGAGIQKGLWQMSDQAGSFAKMMEGLKPWFVVFYGAGVVLATAVFVLALLVLRAMRSNVATELQLRSLPKSGEHVATELQLRSRITNKSRNSGATAP